MRDLTFDDAAALDARAREGDVAFQMDEDAFRAFYDRTARPLWAYLSRISGDPQLADDLLQETYYRFLRAGTAHDGEAHRRNSLFLIATNLVRDRHRRRGERHVALPDAAGENMPDGGPDVATRAQRRTDLARALAGVRPRERALLWLAYAQGASHREIAAAVGVQPGSVKSLLLRARRKLAARLGVRTEEGPDRD